MYLGQEMSFLKLLTIDSSASTAITTSHITVTTDATSIVAQHSSAIRSECTKSDSRSRSSYCKPLESLILMP
jgi:hypothetical protein